VRSGDRIGGCTVVNVGRDSVRLRNGAEEFTVTLTE
jgi:hypothetical protein